MTNLSHCTSEGRNSVRELESHEIDDVSGGGLSVQMSGVKIVGFQFSAGSFSFGEMRIAGGSSYNYWNTPFGSGSYWAK